MRIIRFIDETGQILYGHECHDGEATLLGGNIFESLRSTGRRAAVKKLLAPVEPPAILCIGLNY